MEGGVLFSPGNRRDCLQDPTSFRPAPSHPVLGRGHVSGCSYLPLENKPKTHADVAGSSTENHHTFHRVILGKRRPAGVQNTSHSPFPNPIHSLPPFPSLLSLFMLTRFLITPISFPISFTLLPSLSISALLTLPRVEKLSWKRKENLH